MRYVFKRETICFLVTSSYLYRSHIGIVSKNELTLMFRNIKTNLPKAYFWVINSVVTEKDRRQANLP